MTVFPGGNGGGLALSTAVDLVLCPTFPTGSAVPLQFAYGWLVSLSNVTLVGNSAASPSSIGGGLFIGPGGNVSISNSTITDNRAALFGGGVAAGGQGDATCSLLVGNGTQLAGNDAGHGGAQLYTACQGSLALTFSTMQLSMTESQVSLLIAS
jgi:hypothetical protein